MNPSELSDLLASRRSIRDFRPDPVPTDVLADILSDAAQAPSWSNTQPYRLAIASGDRRDRLAAALCQRFDAALVARKGGWRSKVGLLLRGGLPDGDFRVDLPYPADLVPARRATGFGLYKLLGIAREDHVARDAQMRRNFEFFGAPTVIFVFVHGGLRQFAALDAGIWLQSFMLAAHARGLGTCAQGALATWGGPVRAEFDVPATHKLICGVALGYPSDAPVNAYNPGRLEAAQLNLTPR
jgi:nitroreductase